MFILGFVTGCLVCLAGCALVLILDYLGDAHDDTGILVALHRLYRGKRNA